MRLACAALLAGTLACAQASGTEWRDALGRGDLDALVELAGAGADVDEAGSRGKTALMLAAARGDERVLARLLALGARVDRRNDAGGTALMYAAQYGQAGAARALVDAGAEVNLIAAKGWTALMIAVLKGHASTIELLLDRGADPNLVDMHGYSPLMRALEAARPTVARALLALPSVRLDVAATSGATALHLAAGRGDAELARLLLEKGADPAARDGAGLTPLAIAEREGHAPVVALLRAAAKDD